MHKIIIIPHCCNIQYFLELVGVSKAGESHLDVVRETHRETHSTDGEGQSRENADLATVHNILQNRVRQMFRQRLKNCWRCGTIRSHGCNKPATVLTCNWKGFVWNSHKTKILQFELNSCHLLLPIVLNYVTPGICWWPWGWRSHPKSTSQSTVLQSRSWARLVFMIRKTCQLRIFNLKTQHESKVLLLWQVGVVLRMVSNYVVTKSC